MYSIPIILNHIFMTTGPESKKNLGIEVDNQKGVTAVTVTVAADAGEKVNEVTDSTREALDKFNDNPAAFIEKLIAVPAVNSRIIEGKIEEDRSIELKEALKYMFLVAEAAGVNPFTLVLTESCHDAEGNLYKLEGIILINIRLLDIFCIYIYIRLTLFKTTCLINSCIN